MTNSLNSLGYPHGVVDRSFYTAKVSDKLGACVAEMQRGQFMIQFFPWTEEGKLGHDIYAKFVMDKATTQAARDGVLFGRYPFMLVEEMDILTLKCLIEETIKTLEHPHADHDPSS